MGRKDDIVTVRCMNMVQEATWLATFSVGEKRANLAHIGTEKSLQYIVGLGIRPSCYWITFGRRNDYRESHRSLRQYDVVLRIYHVPHPFYGEGLCHSELKRRVLWGIFDGRGLRRTRWTEDLLCEASDKIVPTLYAHYFFRLH